MPKPAPITLPDLTAGQRVHLRDDDNDVDCKFDIAPLTRSRKRLLRDLGIEAEKLNAVAEERPATDEDDERAVRLLCDMVNVLLVPVADDGPDAGDLLYAGWENERLTDDQIMGLLDRLQATTADPT